MIRTLMTTTALTLMLTGGAMAQDAAATTTAMPSTDILASGYVATDSDNLASEIIGKKVYSSAAADAEHIGDVNNLVIGDDGSIDAVIIGVGGFLGIGEKHVAVSMDALQWVVAEDNSERYVLETTKEALSNAPAFEWTDDEPMDTAATDTMGVDPAVNNDAAMSTDTAANATVPADNSMAADQTATGTVATDTAMAPADGTMMDPLDRTNMAPFDASQLTAEELIGTNVYGQNDEHIGAIGDLALNEDGTVDAVIIDFGGFLGIGTKPVAVAIDNLEFLADTDNNRSLVMPITRDQMDAAPAFDKDSYTANRDSQRIVLDAKAQS